MPSLFSRLFGSRPSAKSPAARMKAQPALEALEDRMVPTVAVAPISYAAGQGTLTITSDSASDTVVVTRLRNVQDDDGYFNDIIRVTINGTYVVDRYAFGDDANYQIVFNG